MPLEFQGAMVNDGSVASAITAQTSSLVNSSVQIVAGAGNSSIDAANLQTAINGLPGTGGAIYLFGYFNLTAATIIVSVPTRFYGNGSSDAYAATNLNTGVNGTQPALYANESEIAATTCYSTSTTLNMFQVNAHGTSFQGIHFSNRAATEPTAGAAIVIGGPSGTPANGVNIDKCSFNRFYINIDVVNSTAYSITANKIIGHIKYGVRVNNVENFDEGDPSIIGNWIMSGVNSVRPDAGIFWQSGGGLRIIGNKISRKGARSAADSVRHRKGIWLQPATGVTTSVFVISGNSIEAIDEAAVLVDCSGTFGNVSSINVSGNEFNMSPFAQSGLSANYVLWCQSGAQVPFNVYFGNNVINGCYTMVRAGANSGQLFSGHIGPNTIYPGNAGGPLIDIQNGPDISYRLDEQKMVGRPAGQILLQDLTAINYNSNGQRSANRREYTREFPAATIGAASNLFAIDIGSGGNSAAVIEVGFNGFLSGPGAHSCAVKRVISGNGAGAANAVSTPTGWTDIALSPNATTTTQVYLVWNFTQSAGVITVSATPTAGGTPTLNTTFAGVVSGEVYIKINGTVRTFVVS
jgi:hypothetical protein